MKRYLRAAGALILCVIAVGCSDGHPCDLTQDESGAAVVRCPDGSSARVVPGSDGDEIAERCEIEEDDGVRWIVCGDIRSALPTDEAFCANGFQGDLMWPPRYNWEAMDLALYEELRCDVLRGELHIFGGALNEIPPWLLDVQQVDILRIGYTTDLEAIAFPNLTVIADGMHIYGNTKLRSVEFPVLQRSSGVAVTENNALESFSVTMPEQIVDNLEIFDNDALTSIDVTVADVGYLSMRGNASLQSVAFHVPGNVDFAYLQGPPSADFELTWDVAGQAEILDVTPWPCVPDLWTDYFRDMIWHARFEGRDEGYCY